MNNPVQSLEVLPPVQNVAMLKFRKVALIGWKSIVQTRLLPRCPKGHSRRIPLRFCDNISLT
jgi:hypothetical protein